MIPHPIYYKVVSVPAPIPEAAVAEEPSHLPPFNDLSLPELENKISQISKTLYTIYQSISDLKKLRENPTLKKQFCHLVLALCVSCTLDKVIQEIQEYEEKLVLNKENSKTTRPPSAKKRRKDDDDSSGNSNLTFLR